MSLRRRGDGSDDPNRSTSRSRSFALGAGVGVVLVSAYVHHQAGFHYPVPWSDEAWDLIPARALAERGSLRVPEMGEPEGIFWLPDGYAVLLAALFRVGLPKTIEAARWVSFAASVAFASVIVGWSARTKRRVAPVVAIAALWLLGPRTVFSSNVARFETITLVFVGFAAFSAASERRAVAVCSCLLGSLVHPAALFFLPAVAFFGRAVRPRSRVDNGVVGLTAVALSIELAYVAWHARSVVEDVVLKLEFKAQNGLYIEATAFPIVVALLAAVLLVLQMRVKPRRDGACLCFALAISSAGVLIVGREVMYQLYGYETALLFLGMGLLEPTSRFAVRPVPLVLATAALTMGVFAFGPQLLDERDDPPHLYAQFGMAIGDGPLDEWDDFVVQVVQEVGAYDQAIGADRRVVLLRDSPLALELTGHRWRHLEFVAETRLKPLTGDCLALGVTRERTRGKAVDRVAGEVAVVSRNNSYAFEMTCDPA